MASGNRLVLTAADKIRLYEEFKQSGLSIRKFVAQRKLAKSCLSRIIKDYDTLKTWPGNRVRRCRSTYKDIDSQLLSWFNSEHCKHGKRKPKTSEIRAKADSLAKNLGYDSWSCSDGWYSRWKRRNGIITGADGKPRPTATIENVTTTSDVVKASKAQISDLTINEEMDVVGEIVTCHGDSSPGDSRHEPIEQQHEEMFGKWQAESREENSAHSGVEHDSSPASSDHSTTYHHSNMVRIVGSTSPVADMIIKTEIDNETWMATLQSREDEHPESTSRATQPATILPSKTQKRAIEMDSPDSSNQPTEKRYKPERGKELDGFSISQLLNKLRDLIGEKNNEMKRHAAEVEIHTRQHVKHMEDMNSREDDIVTAISQRIGV